MPRGGMKEKWLRTTGLDWSCWLAHVVMAMKTPSAYKIMPAFFFNWKHPERQTGLCLFYLFILIRSEVLQEFCSYKVMTEGLGVFIHAWKMNIYNFFWKGISWWSRQVTNVYCFKIFLIKSKSQWIISSCFSVLRFTQT